MRAGETQTQRFEHSRAMNMCFFVFHFLRVCVCAVLCAQVSKLYRFQTEDQRWLLVREQMSETPLSFSLPKQLLSALIEEHRSRCVPDRPTVPFTSSLCDWTHRTQKLTQTSRIPKCRLHSDLVMFSSLRTHRVESLTRLTGGSVQTHLN